MPPRDGSASKRTWNRKIRPVRIVGGDCVITLADGSAAYCDAADAELVRDYNWSLSDGHPTSGLGKLAHVILGKPKIGVYDHKDRDPRNNRRRNLRIATSQQNARNRSKASAKSSRFKGVCLRKDRGTWLATIRIGKCLKKIGTFKSEEEAARAYDVAASELFGEFAALNFVDKFGAAA